MGRDKRGYILQAEFDEIAGMHIATFTSTSGVQNQC